MRLKNKVAVVTGAGRGIGAAIARAFAAEGALVAVTDVCLETASNVAAEIDAAKKRAMAFACDVTDRSAVEDTADRVEKNLGAIAVWVNNAGISRIVPFLDCTEEFWDRTLDINLKGVFLGCQAAIRRMLPRAAGVILNMSSQSGKEGNSRYAAYCASKFGVIGLTQSLALEYAASGIRVNALCPGVVFTPLWEDMQTDYAHKHGIKPEEVKRYLESKIPLGRLCDPRDVADLAVFLASDESSYMTGQAINVSGGTVMD